MGITFLVWYCLIMMTEFKKRKLGLVYDAFDQDIMKMQQRTRSLVDTYNSLPSDDDKEKQKVLKSLFPKDDFGEYRQIEKPMFIDNCYEVKIGRNFYANVDMRLIGGCTITIGDNVFFGPGVTLATGMHSLIKEERRIIRDVNGKLRDFEYGKPIVIEDDVWIASNVTVCPGVTIGEGSVIGAGSVVTRDIPSGVLAFGNPCRVIRKITDRDGIFQGDKKYGLY